MNPLALALALGFCIAVCALLVLHRWITGRRL